MRPTNVQLAPLGGGLQSVRNTSSFVEAFLTYADVRESTRSTYRRALDVFFSWLRSTGRDLDSLSSFDIVAYKDHLKARSLSALTINGYLVALRRFFSFVGDNGGQNPASSVKNERRAKKDGFQKMHVPAGKIEALLQYAAGTTKRDFAIINLMIRTGLRDVEVTRLDVSDISFIGECRVLRVWGKGCTSKDNFVTLTPKAYGPIRDYLAERGPVHQGEPLFASADHSRKGGRLSTRSVSRICKNALCAVGLEGREFTAHSLRHTAAVEILKKTGNLLDVQDALRHASPVTSEIYFASIRKERRLANADAVSLDDIF